MEVDKEDLVELMGKININLSKENLLFKALTHKSYANEKRQDELEDNERLEFLGDSVLDLVVSEYIFSRYSDHPEGELAKIRSVVVSTTMLAAKAREISLGDYILLGKGEEQSGGRSRDSILADTFEALVGCIYLDQGFNQVRNFILDLLIPNINDVEMGEHIQDYKTLLQELIQKETKQRPVYEVINEEGPDHEKVFTIQVKIENEILGIGRGKSKKEAEQQAAQNAIEKSSK